MLWASPDFYVNGTPYAPDTPFIVTNLDQLVTNSLVIPGNTSLDFSTEYWDTSNYWTHAESYRSSADYEVKPLTLETHTTITTQKIQDLVIGQNCASNPTSIINDVYYTNVFLDPILITTNNLTNVEVMCFFTNVATYSLTVWRTDRSGVTNAPPWCSTCLPPGLSNVTTTTLLPTTTYNNFTNGVIVASAFTNWDIAQGYSESDYGYDGVRKIDSSKTWQSATINWYNGKGINLISHGMTNNTTDIAGADADKLGSWSMCIITTSVAAAESALTNSGGGYSGAPFATRFMTLQDSAPCGLAYIKDIYTAYGVTASINYGADIYIGNVCEPMGSTYDVSYMYCDASNDYCNWNYPDDQTCYCPFPDRTAAEAAARAMPRPCGKEVFPNWNPGEVVEIVYDGFYGTFTRSTVSDCTTLKSIIDENIDKHCCDHPALGNGSTGSSDGSFTYSVVSESVEFWHGVVPCETNVCNTTDGVINYAGVTWTKTGEVTNNVNSGLLCFGSEPVFSPTIRTQLQATRNSALGAINSILPRFECQRDLYLSGNLDLPLGGRIDTWYNTKYMFQGLAADGGLAVQLATNMQTIYFSALPTGSPQTWGNNHYASYQHNVTTYPTYSVAQLWCYGSNVTMMVTNAYWTQYADLDTSETPTGFGTKAIDPDLGTPRYYEVGAANGWTNLWKYNTFIKNTVTLPGDAAFDHLKGFGVWGGVLILKWDKTADGFSRP